MRATNNLRPIEIRCGLKFFGPNKTTPGYYITIAPLTGGLPALYTLTESIFFDGSYLALSVTDNCPNPGDFSDILLTPDRNVYLDFQRQFLIIRYM